MPIKTRVAKYKKLSDMRSAWSEKFNGKLIEINNITYKVYQVWIKGLTYKVFLVSTLKPIGAGQYLGWSR